MHIYITKVGGRKFINFDDIIALPIDRIKAFDFRASNGGATGHSVKIETDDPNEEIFFAYANCEAVRRFLEDNAELDFDCDLDCDLD